MAGHDFDVISKPVEPYFSNLLKKNGKPGDSVLNPGTNRSNATKSFTSETPNLAPEIEKMFTDINFILSFGQLKKICFFGMVFD